MTVARLGQLMIVARLGQLMIVARLGQLITVARLGQHMTVARLGKLMTVAHDCITSFRKILNFVVMTDNITAFAAVLRSCYIVYQQKTTH